MSIKCIFLISLIILSLSIEAYSFIIEGVRASLDSYRSTFSGGMFFITYENTSFTIESHSDYGNFSFTFRWENPGLFIYYNHSSYEIRELKQISLTDKTANYTFELWMPRLLYEYIDVDGNNLFTGSTNSSFIVQGPDILLSSYKINTNIGMTNVTIREDLNGQPVCEWACTQLAMPMEGNVQGPWEKYPTVKEVFHYHPINGTLKMDVVLDNFKPENASSRVFISYGVQFIRLEPGNSTVVFDNHEFTPAEIEKVYPSDSTTIKFKINNVERGMFDFGGDVAIDGLTGFNVHGSIGPPDLYWLIEKYDWVTIGLNYPHINQSMRHDPYFGFILAGATGTTPFISNLTIVATIVFTVILIVVIYDYDKTKKHLLNNAVTYGSS